MKSVTLKGTPTTKNTSTLVSTEGGSSYKLADTNTSIQNRIRYFSITTTGSKDDGNVTFTPAAYIEADGVVGYDMNDTLLGTTTIFAPANSAIASPLTSLAVLANAAFYGTGGTMRSWKY
ncbi:MAG: hypothetical protein Q9M43_00225 [Sulfurimonas sp.]|nr:hypothetical protein [Sulfurimonas sp.]